MAIATAALGPASGTAYAQGSSGISLNWSAPAGCPDAAHIMAEVDLLLGKHAAQPARAIHVTASVSREDDGAFRVRIETPGKGTTRVREVRGASCAAVADTTALILAMMINPSAVAGASGRPPGATPPPALLPAPPAASTPPPEPPAGSTSPIAPSSPPASSAMPPAAPSVPPGTRPPGPRPPETAQVRVQPRDDRAPMQARPPAPAGTSSRSILFGLLGWGGADLGMLPGVAPGFGFSGFMRYGPQSVELGIGVWPDRTAKLPTRPSAGGDIGLTAGALGTCRNLLTGPLAIAPCVALELGRMHASGFGVRSPDRGAGVWTALKGGGALTLTPLKGFGLVVRLDAVIPLVAPTFVLGRVGEVYRATPVTGRGAAGVELTF